MEDSGFAITPTTRRRDDEGPAASSSTTASNATDADAFARAVEALLYLAVSLPAAAVLRRLARVAPTDWHLVADAREVCGTWLGAALPHATVWAQVDAATLPALGMVALNEGPAVAQLAHDRPWEAHATDVGALEAAARAARAGGHAEVRVSLAGPDGARGLTVSAELLGHVAEAVAALGAPPRSVWAYLLDDDDDGDRALVLDGGAWLAVVGGGHARPLVTGRAAAPWPLALTEVVSTIDARSVGGRRVPLLSMEVH